MKRGAQEKELAWTTEPSGCWRCTSHVAGSNGYPMIKRLGKRVKISRFMLEKKIGKPLRKKSWALHKCDNAWCINPNHLYEGDQKDNEIDKVLRGRSPKGEGHGMTKLREVDVVAIRLLFSIGYGGRTIAKFFRISPSEASNINHQRTWRKRNGNTD